MPFALLIFGGYTVYLPKSWSKGPQIYRLHSCTCTRICTPNHKIILPRYIQIKAKAIYGLF